MTNDLFQMSSMSYGSNGIIQNKKYESNRLANIGGDEVFLPNL